MISKVLYGALFLVVLLAAIAFGGENSQLVSLDLVFFALPQMSLFVLVLGAMAIGILIGLIPSLILVPYLKLKMNAMSNRVDMLEQAPAQE
ncbi:MAG TPA: hypothetical protein DHW71_14750 [Gammaproteobacteria bacterium]|nr:hypothetical protein [Gammaproteobacteria bacterium]MEC8010988.1 LapA family protein [Pseudomonadota bacterium]HBF07660.1 hypothetical protein [Gammaproteobacteria bacterium]HCK94252.1 hypothetical protein [Gammaproteobacteria bacterium]|tara:strand:- start:1703 stop:1975 length:273 start_codon:yes stop_codon:yes gene_type:complete